ncbi:MAG: flagellar hook-associated protein FlgK [Treponema sp.]|jgi:flagellar hook-associated protein 1 FlgK|nr:flagellar hook-associated protein FlgK [Treponema sp.]
MTSTFLGIEIGKRAVDAHQQALNVTGHNLSNASTPGYSRQRVEFAPFEPIYLPGLNREETPGQIGQGVVVERIERVRDELLDKRIIAQAGGEGYWGTRDPYVREMGKIYLEPGANSIRDKMDKFWESWQDLSNHPTDNAPRMAVLERGKTLIDGIHERYMSLKRLQDQSEEDIRMTVDNVNDIVRQIAGLNDDIQKIKAQGDNPNDLLDRRDLMVDKLSSLVNVSVDRRDPDEFMVHTGGITLVQGRIGRRFDLERNPETGYSDVVWQETRQRLEFRNGDHDGSLGALVDLRDHTIRSEIQTLDNMTMNFVGLVNEVHRGAYGINGITGQDFFTEYPFVTNVNGNYDRDGDGEYDSSYIFRVSGVNPLESRAQVGLEGVITLSAADGMRRVSYYPTDTVADIITRINNSGAEVTARLNRDGVLTMKGTPSEANPGVNPDFVIRHIEDSGQFLVGYAGLLNASGGEGAFDWAGADGVAALRSGSTGWEVAPIAHPSGWIEVNPALVRDPGSVAAGFGENGRPANPGNGEAALAVAAIRDTEVMVGQFRTFDDYFADSVGRIGLLGEQSARALETQNLVMKDLRETRQSISGVNIDEELGNLIKYQHGYAAAARFITTVNSMLDTIINRMGV